MTCVVKYLELAVKLGWCWRRKIDQWKEEKLHQTKYLQEDDQEDAGVHDFSPLSTLLCRIL
jgi:hypothetical protein